MGRTTFQLNCSNNQAAYNTICTILTSRGYQYIFENNEYVWKQGIGVLTAVKYIKIEFPADHVILVTGWIRPLLFPEMALDNGFIGLIPKREALSVIDQIKANIR